MLRSFVGTGVVCCVSEHLHEDMAGIPRAVSGHRQVGHGKSRRNIRCLAICQRQIKTSEEHSIALIGAKATGARRKGGQRKRVWSQTHDAEEPLADLTTGHLAEGRVRYVLCNQIL